MSSTHMKMMIALRRTRTPMAPMVKSTADNASDSASIDASSPSADDDSTDDGHEQQDARQLEREEVLVEERLRDASYRTEGADGVRIVATARRERLGKPGGHERHDLGEECEAK